MVDFATKFVIILELSKLIHENYQFIAQRLKDSTRHFLQALAEYRIY